MPGRHDGLVLQHDDGLALQHDDEGAWRYGAVTVVWAILVALHIGSCRGALVHALGVPML